MLMQYFGDACRQNYRNGLRYLRHIATPTRWNIETFDAPLRLPNNLFYHQEYGKYFETQKALEQYLRQKVFSMKTDLKSLSSPESVFQWKVTEHM